MPLDHQSKQKLENLVRIGQLHREPFNKREFEGLLNSARDRLNDAAIETLSFPGRFDLIYNASHALGLAALRFHGYRSDNRFQVFQCLAHSLDFLAVDVRVFSQCHDRRNLAEYEGHLEIEAALLDEFVRLSNKLLVAVESLYRSAEKD